MGNKHHPYPDRKEHDYANEMHIIISKMRLIIKEAVQAVDRLQATADEHLEIMRQTRKEDARLDQEIPPSNP